MSEVKYIWYVATTHNLRANSVLELVGFCVPNCTQDCTQPSSVHLRSSHAHPFMSIWSSCSGNANPL